MNWSLIIGWVGYALCIISPILMVVALKFEKLLMLMVAGFGFVGLAICGFIGASDYFSYLLMGCVGVFMALVCFYALICLVDNKVKKDRNSK